MSISDTSGFGLEPGFAEKLSSLLDICRAAGYEFRVSQGLRTPQKQAEYYCRWDKRKPADIDAAAKKMKNDGAPWLASVLLQYRNIARQADWLTSALPGAGWHQWGEAADCYCYRNGKMVENGGDPCYKFYAEQAVKLGLTAGYYFQHQDSGHVQLQSAATAASIYTWHHIDETMKSRFGDKDEVALSAGAKPTSVSSSALVAFTPLALTETAAPSGYYKDDTGMVQATLTPALFIDTTGTKGTLRALAETYNRVGGLIETFGKLTSIDPVAALAVWYVESGGRKFTLGLPVLRFENHKLFKYWGATNVAQFDKYFQFGGHAGIPGASHKNHKFRVSTKDAWQSSHVDDQSVEYKAFRFAETLSSREKVCLSSSFGGPQIMGFNHKICGYASASALADAFATDERWQVLGFADFCKSNNLIDEIRNRKWLDFGQAYNGDGAVYGPKLEDAYNFKGKLAKLPRQPSPGGLAGGLATAGTPVPKSLTVETTPAALGSA
ncbi:MULTISPECIES: N-acetylmuramidase domain-containing protein [unclassified Mesorhizobium]|uniref:N-acetylmuramidase domain-containing protein n=1 Tax=unclassified Mesorhizobium TaxID=325217 RepID=UPI0003CEA7C8|nr:N-acetylmuramidase domain-containing protein [Mesorhizobium sp. LSHC412B00]ESX84054.1 hypothetical protein X756_27735 [Mesorhizobium sp. LSHC412B00]